MSEATNTDTPSSVLKPTRGPVTEGLVEVLKTVRAQTGLPGFAVIAVVLFAASFYLFRAVIGVAGPVIGTSAVGALATLTTVAYTFWVALNAHDEFTDRTEAEAISERPSIDTADDAFELLTSADEDAREYAAACVADTVSLGPSKVLTVLRSDPEVVVEFVIPYLRSDQEAVRAELARALSFFARDYPDAVSTHSGPLLDLLDGTDLSPEVRAEVATSVGFLCLSSTDVDTDRVEQKGFELADAADPDLRIAACYMLAGVESDDAQARLKQLAEGDQDENVRAHAGELY